MSYNKILHTKATPLGYEACHGGGLRINLDSLGIF